MGYAPSVPVFSRLRVKMFDKHLVDAISAGSAELSVNTGLTIEVLTRGHGSLLLDL